MLLRGFELRHDVQVLRPCVSEQRLVALLAVRGALPRSVVSGLLWPDANGPRAQGNLRTALWRLVKLGPGLMAVDGDRLALRAASPVHRSFIGRIEMGLDEGVTGWVATNKEAAAH